MADIKTSEYLYFFQRDKGFKKYIKELIEKGERKRHKLAYADRNVPIFKSELCSLGNMFFLREEEELKVIKISLIHLFIVYYLFLIYILFNMGL